MEKVNKNNENVRRAMYKVYNKKCYITGEPIKYREMQIDHIIPESLKNNEIELKKALKKYGLSNTFDLDSLYNLAPTDSYENRRKGGKQYTVAATLHYLEIASDKVQKIQEEIKWSKKNEKFDFDSSKVKSYIDDIDEVDEKKKTIEKLFDFITNDDNKFAKCNQTYVYDEKIVYKRYTERIALEAILPQYNDCETEAVLYFKTLKLRDCKIILDNKIILTELFSGINTNPELSIRGFIIDEKITTQSENIEIRLGNNSVRLSYDDVKMLCEVIDDYSEAYIKRIKDIERILQTQKFELSRRKNCYKLFEISGSEWMELIRFVRKHDVDRGFSKWHIFDAESGGSMIKVYTNRTQEKYKEGYHSIFKIERHEDTVLYPTLTSNNYIVTWEFTEDLDKKSIEAINDRENWNAAYACEWFENKLINKVISSKKQSFFSNMRKIPEQLIPKAVDRVKYILSSEINNYDEFKDTIELLQVHFHMRARQKYLLDKEDLQGIYEIYLKMLYRFKRLDKHYICQKLYIKSGCNREELLSEIQKLKDEVQKTIVSGYRIDLLFRGLCRQLMLNKLTLEQKEIEKIFSVITGIIEIYNRETLLEKYAVDFTY